jgi:hypothetical protein
MISTGTCCLNGMMTFGSAWRLFCIYQHWPGQVSLLADIAANAFPLLNTAAGDLALHIAAHHC